MLPETVYILLQLCLFAAASPLLDSEMITGGVSRSGSDKRKAANQARSNSRSSNSAPVREIPAASSDPSNQQTVAMGKSDRYPADHQTVRADIDVSQNATAAASDRSWGDIELAASSESHDHAAASEETHSEDSGSHSSWPDSDQTKNCSSSGEMSISGELAEIKSLGRYQITGVLGKGAMGTVYRGVDPAINRPVALKTIRLDFINDPAEFEELKERLYREAQAAGKLSHPNIVTIYDVGSEGPLQYIAMEYLEGQTLENLIRKKVKFNYRIIAQIITQMCQALEYAHDRGIVHRDIKPANVMVLADYRIKVMDFGIARIDSNSMTKTGIAMGTPNYISPEQLKGLPIDRRADLFSLGVVMYEMLLGRRPFKGENITSLIYSILHHEPEKPSAVNPQIPLLFDHIVIRALKKVPAERYQKASDLMADLHDFVESFTNR
jgi:predicted Ser/Thr protein kinase